MKKERNLCRKCILFRIRISIYRRLRIMMSLKSFFR